MTEMLKFNLYHTHTKITLNLTLRTEHMVEMVTKGHSRQRSLEEHCECRTEKPAPRSHLTTAKKEVLYL